MITPIKKLLTPTKQEIQKNQYLPSANEDGSQPESDIPKGSRPERIHISHFNNNHNYYEKFQIDDFQYMRSVYCLSSSQTRKIFKVREVKTFHILPIIILLC